MNNKILNIIKEKVVENDMMNYDENDLLNILVYTVDTLNSELFNISYMGVQEISDGKYRIEIEKCMDGKYVEKDIDVRAWDTVEDFSKSIEYILYN